MHPVFQGYLDNHFQVRKMLTFNMSQQQQAAAEAAAEIAAARSSKKQQEAISGSMKHQVPASGKCWQQAGAGVCRRV